MDPIRSSRAPDASSHLTSDEKSSKSHLDEKLTAIAPKILKEFDRSDLPVVTNMDFGHTDPMMTLPYGRIMQIDVDEKKITLLESAVI